MAQIGEYFAATRWGLSFLEECPPIDANTPCFVRLALSLDYNPVLRYLVEHHAPVHEEVILSPGVWQTICPRAEHGHVMIGPITASLSVASPLPAIVTIWHLMPRTWRI